MPLTPAKSPSTEKPLTVPNLAVLMKKIGDISLVAATAVRRSEFEGERILAQGPAITAGGTLADVL
jgi:hypothetical protein